MHEDDGGKSFLEHMVKSGNDQVGLTNYANLIYAGFAKVPVGSKRVSQFMEDLLPYVSRCRDCDEPMCNGRDIEECEGCVELHAAFLKDTVDAYELHRNTGFCCLEYEGLPYRKPWQRVGRAQIYTTTRRHK